MKIAHVSDLHIRNFKYRNEYNSAFEELYKKLEIIKPDLVINTGDTVHSKLAVSPELFDDVANHFLRMSSIAPYWVILGNHDLNLKNSNRMDAISPIIRALQGRTKHELRLCEPGRNEFTKFFVPGVLEFPYHQFYNYDIRGHEKFEVDESKINIGLYHGSISGCVTDIGFVMEDGEAEVKKFDDMDFVLLGDIHKRQEFKNGRIQYPGSLIQQNYGEELVKGFLLWNIVSKHSFTVDFHEISNVPGRFYTIEVPEDLSLDSISVPKGSRVRAVVKGDLSPSKRLELEKSLSSKFAPIEIITPDSSGEMTSPVVDIDNLVGSRDQLMKDHLKERGLEEAEAEAVVKLFEEYEKGIDSDSSARGTTWQLKKVSWDNMMNYGEGNSIDLDKLKGLVGVFAPNASGKSSIFDIMLQSLFDKVAKDVPRNIDLVNDNKDSAKMSVEFESSGKPFLIERSIERISYGQKKLSETKQWGKTSLDFSSIDDSLNGTSRPETEKVIRGIIGNFDDFALTTMVSQNPIFGMPGGGDIINCRETDRRKILFRFLDLDIFEKVNQECKEELKSILGNIKNQDSDNIANEIENIEVSLLSHNVQLKDARADSSEHENFLSSLQSKLSQLENDNKAQLSINLTKLDDITVSKLKKCRLSLVDLEKAKDFLSSATKKHHDLLQNKPKKPSIPLNELISSIEKLRSDRENIKISLSKQKDALERGKKSLVTLDGVPCEGKFPTCKFISEASEFLVQRSIIEDAIRSFESSSGDLDKEFSTLEGYDVMHKSVLRWELDVAAAAADEEKCAMLVKSSQSVYDEAVRVHAEAVKNYEEAVKSVDHTLYAQIANLKPKVDIAKSAFNDSKQRIESFLKMIGALDSKKISLENELKKINDMKRKVKVFESLAEMTGKNGLPYRILALVLPLINNEISKILNGVVKFNVFFEDDTEEQTVSLFIRYGDYKSRPLSLGSGAEKFIASIAIRVALLSVSSLPKTDILIIDEGFGKLDPEHLESLQKMFEYLKEAFGTVFIVSHVDSMRDIVDHSLDITSLDGYAHVEVA